MKEVRSPEIDELFGAILALESVEECYAFFGDVCTIKEVLEMAQRFEVANLLETGMSYVDISVRSGASSATISRVNRCLKYSDGYRTAIDRLKEQKKSEK